MGASEEFLRTGTNLIMGGDGKWLSKAAHHLISSKSIIAAKSILAKAGAETNAGMDTALSNIIKSTITATTSHGNEAGLVFKGASGSERLTVPENLEKIFKGRLQSTELSDSSRSAYVSALDKAMEAAFRGIKAAQYGELKHPLPERSLPKAILKVAAPDASYIDPQSREVIKAYAMHNAQKTLEHAGKHNPAQIEQLLGSFSTEFEAKILEQSAKGSLAPQIMHQRSITKHIIAAVDAAIDQMPAGSHQALISGNAEITAQITNLQGFLAAKRKG